MSTLASTSEALVIDLSITSGIAVLKLNAPPLNILTRSVLASLRAALAKAVASADTRVVLLTAQGKHFSAGASVEEHLPPECDVMIEEFAETVLALYGCPVPVIAAVQGRCLGGAFELVQAADLVIAAEDAQFGQPEIFLGVFPPAACALLPAWAGNSRAAELLFTGDSINAESAAAAGFVISVVARESLESEAMTVAGRIARHSAAALRATKQALRAGSAHLPQRLARAAQIYRHDLMRTHDAIEGLHAFLEKRPPQWSHA